MDGKAKVIQANLLLFLAAVIWGGGFVAQRLGMESIGPFVFNGFRFALGAVTLLPLILLRRSNHSRSKIPWSKTILVGTGAGLFLFGGATFQQVGLQYTTAGKAGFVTGLYVVFVPLLGVLWGDKSTFKIWVGAGLAAVGLYFLSMTGPFKLAPGDGYELLGALFWAGHVQFIAHQAGDNHPVRISFVQAVATSLLSFAVGFAVEEFSLEMIRGAVMPILYGGVISIGLAYTFQVVAQRYAHPSHAAIILSLESVFAVLWGGIFLGERLSGRGWIGAALMLGGMIISQLKLPGRDRNIKTEPLL